ncbi:hypothetical protein [Paenibacillus naphthalenovorans]|uniref:hypothetical protein n=1 Tax=Paenibacillus naphthalenovorans TaxID=162209 RepID=UPI0008882742|nr:hypothetical protein [Paenibacillus naphthalenovorans]SDI48966.1 hypothetical protein SAMN05421868_10717 [Paenibacillus naphthalenovorans]
MTTPQAGVITGRNETEQLVKVFLPLFKIETDWIRTAVHVGVPLDGAEVVVVFVNGQLNDGVVIAEIGGVT